MSKQTYLAIVEDALDNRAPGDDLVEHQASELFGRGGRTVRGKEIREREENATQH